MPAKWTAGALEELLAHEVTERPENNVDGAFQGKFRDLLLSPWTMVFAGLALRLAVMDMIYKVHLRPELDHWSFGAEMGRVARSIVTGHGFSSPYPWPSGPTAHVAPIYPYLLASIFKLFGVYTTASAIAILTLQCLFSSLTCLPVFLIARKVFGPRVAAWSGWIWACFPYCLYVSDFLIWETALTTLLITLLILATLELEGTTNYGAWAGYGLLWGLAGLTGPAVLATLPFLGGWIWMRHWKRGGDCTRAAVVASLTFLIAVSPWVWRSSALYGRFVPFRGTFGMEMLVGNTDDRLPDNSLINPEGSEAELEKLRQVGEPAYMAEMQRRAIELVSQRPLHFAKLCLRRILNTWTGLWNFPPHWTLDGIGLPHILTYSLISLLSFFGLGCALWNRIDGAIPLAIVVASYPILYYLTLPSMRHRHPIDPVVTIFLAYGATWLWQRYTEARKQIESACLRESIAT